MFGLGGKNKDTGDYEALESRKVIPSVNAMVNVRRIENDALEDFSGRKWATWQISGADARMSQVTTGWLTMINSIEYPIQVLIRQHSPDFSEFREKLMMNRPSIVDDDERIGSVANSLLDYLVDLENGKSRVVTRRFYLTASEDRVMEAESVMSHAGLDFDRLRGDQLDMLYQGCVSGMGAGHVQEVYQVREEKALLELNQRFAALYGVTKWPRSISPVFMESLLRTGLELDISFWIWPVSMRESYSRLQMQRSRFEGARLSALQKGKLVSPEVDVAISDVSRIADEVQRGISRLFRRTMMVSVYGRSRDDLRGNSEEVSGQFRAVLASVEPMKFREGKALACMVPAGRRGIVSPDLTDSYTMLRMFPFGPQDMDQREGSLLGLDGRSCAPVIFDPFSPKSMNGHMVVMARSGAGKSFFTKLRVLREALRGIPIYLIDPEGEYGVITRALGGEVFVPGSEGHGLNPFAIGYNDDGDLTKRISGLGSLVGVMLEGRIDNDMKAIIDRALTAFYALELEAVIDLPRDQQRLGRGGMEAFHAFLSSEEAQEFDGKTLAHLLSRFATGSSRFLMRGDARDLMDYEAPVTSFNMKHLSGALKPVAISVCAEVVWGLAVQRPRPRLLVVDECWTVLATPSGAESLITIVKRARKYQLGLMAITQDVQDFLSENNQGDAITSHAGRSLLQNSATKLAFSQDPGSLPQVVEALGLDDETGAYLAGSLRGQGILIGENGSPYPIEIVSTVLERELVTDDSWRQDGEVIHEDDIAALAGGSGGAVDLAESLLSGVAKARAEDEAVSV